MKIEMGESLFYSWLRHIKGCQMVQMNWTPSSQWDADHEEEIENLLCTIDDYFQKRYQYKIFKKNTKLSQIMRQAENDVLGIRVEQERTLFFAVDVAFHELGLSYGSRQETVMKVLFKMIRTAFCLYKYFGLMTGEIIFASPKINPSILSDLLLCVADLNEFFNGNGFHFSFEVICNDAFGKRIIQPVFYVSEKVADTNELFMRAYKMCKMHDASIKKQ